MADELRIAIFGVTGRMGQALIHAVEESPGASLSGASASPHSEWIGRELSVLGGTSKIVIANSAASALRDADVAIDFTLPDATASNLAACLTARCPIVIGTTGHSETLRKQIAEAARSIPVLCSPNMSLGVNLLLRLVQLAAQKLDETYDIEIFEAHHRNKKDSPSGTALALGRSAAAGRNVELERVAEHDRHGSSVARRAGAIGFSVFRGGDVIGDHTVTFAGRGERIELTHRASDRMAFARGAVAGAQWLAKRAPGLYSMQDVLALT
jgi:4-hydroxy-tetrahydrodipicolinate reductase